MKYLRQWKARTGFWLLSVLFASFIITPNVFAAGYAWTEHAVTAQYWYSIGSSADGKYLAACAFPGHIYTSSDYGATWDDRASLGTSQWCSPPNAIAMSSDGQHQIMMVNSILSSNDYGVTWTSTPYPNDPDVLDAVAMSPDGKYLAATEWNGGIWTSSDFGATWTEQIGSGSQTWSSIASSSDGSHIVATVGNGDIWTSSDYGVTWTDRTTAGPHTWNSVASSSDGKYLVATEGRLSPPTTGDLWTSNDYGVTWTDRTTAGTRRWSAVASNSSGRYLTAVADSGNIWTSSDYGVTWTIQTAAGSLGWTAVTSNGTGSRLAATVWNGTIWTAYDPALDPLTDTDTSTTSITNTTSSTDAPAAPDTGLAPTAGSNLVNTALLTGAFIAAAGGLLMLYRQKSCVRYVATQPEQRSSNEAP